MNVIDDGIIKKVPVLKNPLDGNSNMFQNTKNFFFNTDKTWKDLNKGIESYDNTVKNIAERNTRVQQEYPQRVSDLKNLHQEIEENREVGISRSDIYSRYPRVAQQGNKWFNDLVEDISYRPWVATEELGTFKTLSDTFGIPSAKGTPTRSAEEKRKDLLELYAYIDQQVDAGNNVETGYVHSKYPRIKEEGLQYLFDAVGEYLGRGDATIEELPSYAWATDLVGSFAKTQQEKDFYWENNDIQTRLHKNAGTYTDSKIYNTFFDEERAYSNMTEDQRYDFIKLKAIDLFYMKMSEFIEIDPEVGAFELYERYWEDYVGVFREIVGSIVSSMDDDLMYRFDDRDQEWGEAWEEVKSLDPFSISSAEAFKKEVDIISNRMLDYENIHARVRGAIVKEHFYWVEKRDYLGKQDTENFYKLLNVEDKSQRAKDRNWFLYGVETLFSYLWDHTKTVGALLSDMMYDNTIVLNEHMKGMIDLEREHWSKVWSYFMVGAYEGIQVVESAGLFAGSLMESAWDLLNAISNVPKTSKLWVGGTAGNVASYGIYNKEMTDYFSMLTNKSGFAFGMLQQLGRTDSVLAPASRALFEYSSALSRKMIEKTGADIQTKEAMQEIAENETALVGSRLSHLMGNSKYVAWIALAIMLWLGMYRSHKDSEDALDPKDAWEGIEELLKKEIEYLD